MVDAPDLPLARTTIWRRRVPLWVLRLAVAVPLAALVVVEMTGEAPCTVADPCRDPLGSVGYLLGAAVVFCSIACVPLALLAPRIAPWPAAALATTSAVVPASDSVIRPGWAVAAGLWLALAAADGLLRWRQEVLAQGWDSVHVQLPVPLGVPARLPRSGDARVAAAGVLLLTSLAVPALLAWHVRDVAGVRAFEARAVRVDARVVSTADDGATLRLDVDGRRASVDALELYEPGDVVPVLVDPASPAEVALEAEPRDPSWLLGLAAVVALLGLTAALRLWARGAERALLVAKGGPAVRLRAGWRGDELVLGAADDRYLERPLARLPDDLRPVSYLLDPRHDEDDEHELAEGAPDDRGALWTSQDFPAGLGDADLVVWADLELEQEEEDNEDAKGRELSLARAIDGGTVVTVVGLRRDAAPLALLDEDGEAWLTAAVRDPWQPLDLATLGVEAVLGRPLGRPGSPQAADQKGRTWRPGAPGDDVTARQLPSHHATRDRILRAALPPLERYGRSLAYATAALAYPVARWLYGDSPSVWSLLHSLWVLLGPAEGLMMLAGLGQAALVPHRAGVLHRGLLLARVLPARRVVDVLAGRRALVFRLTAPDDAVTVPATSVVTFGRAALADAPSPEQAREHVLRWLAAATDHEPRWPTRPVAALGPALVLLLAVVAAWAAPRLAG